MKLQQCVEYESVYLHYLGPKRMKSGLITINRTGINVFEITAKITILTLVILVDKQLLIIIISMSARI